MSTNFGHNLGFTSIINPAALKSLSTAVDVAGGVRYLIEKNLYAETAVCHAYVTGSCSFVDIKCFEIVAFFSA